MIVLGDHGENIGDHGFLGHQYNLYDGLLHVPLLVHGGAFSDEPAVDDRLVQLPDVVPTLVDVTGIDAPGLRAQSQAHSFGPGTDASREYPISEYISPQPPVETLAARFDDLPDYADAYDRRLRAIRADGYKLITGSDGLEELYHVAEDPGETVDRSGDQPDRARRLRDELEEWVGSFPHAQTGTAPAMDEATKDRLADLGSI